MSQWLCFGFLEVIPLKFTNRSNQHNHTILFHECKEISSISGTWKPELVRELHPTSERCEARSNQAFVKPTKNEILLLKTT
jgi:hypothetical protein